MKRQDDMVFKVDLGRQVGPSARARAAMDRKLFRTMRRGGRVRDLIEGAAKRRAARKMFASRRILARMGTRSMARGLVSRGMAAGGRAAATNPIGIAIVVGVVAAMVGLRLASGKPFEGWGEELNEMFLGDLDDEARAKMATRQQLQGNPDVARAIHLWGQDPSKKTVLPPAVSERIKLYNRLNKYQQDGETLFRRILPANSTLDMLILRLAAAIKKAWKECGGPEALERLCDAYRIFIMAWRAALGLPGYLLRDYIPY